MKENYKHLAAYEAHLVLKNYSKATRKSYVGALRKFLNYRMKEGLTGLFTQGDARSYLLLRHKEGLKWATINCDYSAIYKFYKEVLKIEWDVKHIPRPRQERIVPVLLSKEKVKKIIEQGHVFKHQVFMTFLYCTGLRLSEALHLQLADIDGERLQLRVAKGKGGKGRCVDIPLELLVLLREYYRVYRPKVYLFNGKVDGCVWAMSSAQWAVRKARDNSGIMQRVTPHVFRHCYATHHLEGGTNLVYLKDQLGHNDLKTTARYIRLCKSYQKQVKHPIVGMQITYRPEKQ